MTTLYQSTACRETAERDPLGCETPLVVSESAPVVPGDPDSIVRNANALLLMVANVIVLEGHKLGKPVVLKSCGFSLNGRVLTLRAEIRLSKGAGEEIYFEGPGGEARKIEFGGG